MYRRENNFLWIATGINPLLDSEIARRVCSIRLDTGVEDPETLTYKKDLLKWVPKHRPQLVWAILTLINNWLAEGQPRFKDRSLKSFDDWAEVVGGILQTSGVRGFLDNPRGVNAGSEDAELRLFAKEMFDKWALDKQSFADLAKWAVGAELPLIQGYDEGQKRQSVKKVLHRLEGRTFEFENIGPVRFMIVEEMDEQKFKWEKVS